ncbi:MAG: hypothetical protein AAFV19_06225 [Pseudomonadota bacterium]
MLGFAAQDWLAPDFLTQRMAREDLLRLRMQTLTEASAGKGHELTYRMTDSLGREVWVHQVCDLCDDPAREGATVLTGYIVDVTERLAHRADLARLMDLREALLKVINVDLSQPVNIVSGYARLLERHLANQGDDVGSDYAVGMRDGIETLSGIVMRLRAAAQGEKMSVDEMIGEMTPDRSGDPSMRRVMGGAPSGAPLNPARAQTRPASD